MEALKSNLGAIVYVSNGGEYKIRMIMGGNIWIYGLEVVKRWSSNWCWWGLHRKGIVCQGRRPLEHSPSYFWVSFSGRVGSEGRRALWAGAIISWRGPAPRLPYSSEARGVYRKAVKLCPQLLFPPKPLCTLFLGLSCFTAISPHRRVDSLSLTCGPLGESSLL